MTFISFAFPLLLAATFALYWTRLNRHQNGTLLAASYLFYAWWDYRFAALLFTSSLVGHLVGQKLDRIDRKRSRQGWLAAGCVANFGILCAFKYFNFFADSFARLLHLAGMNASPLVLEVILPLGISFYTFQSVSYTVDIFRRELRPPDSPADFFLFVAFFPQLVAGPIERASNVLPQFAKPRSFDPELAAEGCRQILWGLFKKMAIADVLAIYVNQAYAAPEHFSGTKLLFATGCFAVQIYCDFSAYSEIASGTAKLFGIRLMRNFRYPYFSRNVAEFWRRWHISLSTWFRDYVFVPLGGSRGSSGRTAANLLLVFGLSGLWHGASWNFVVWGLLNGSALVVLRMLRLARGASAVKPPRLEGVPDLFRIGATFSFVCFTWIFFRASDLPTALLIVERIILVPFGGTGEFVHEHGKLFYMGLTAAFLLAEWIRRNDPHPLARLHMGRPMRWALYSAIVWLALLLYPSTPSEFIYFQF